ncbi:chitinase, putative [Ixodes scapularis]|uniref:Chitinase, putative n=1 Tax=Ixodes scapularis TaxID=6945 RepID=B7P3I7_IXOSC|nr:chitinase, putative [Ixodes scapularis]|eukprot:XP_002404286.1 chitinase, putative [Ixodes scapularis]
MASKQLSRVACKHAPAHRIRKLRRPRSSHRSSHATNVTPLSEASTHSSFEGTERSADGEDEDRLLNFYKTEMAKSNTMLYVTRISFCIFVVFAMYLLGMMFFFRTSSSNLTSPVEKIVYRYAPAIECQVGNTSHSSQRVFKRLDKVSVNLTSTQTADYDFKASTFAVPQSVRSQSALRGSELENPGPTDHLLFCFFNHTSYRRKSPMTFDVLLIPAGLCTHIIYAAAGIDSTFMVRWTDEPYDRDQGAYKTFLALRDRHVGVKLLVALGETWEDWRAFRDMVSEHSLIRTFAQNLARWVMSKTFDGVVINWRYPRKLDRWRLTDMVREVKSRFAPKRLILALTLPHGQTVRRTGFDVAKLGELADFLLFRLYSEINSTVRKTTFPVTSEDVTRFPKAVRSEMGKTVFHKACFVLPLVGLTFTLRNRDHQHVGAATVGPGSPGPYTKVPGLLAYNEVCTGNWSLVSADIFATFAVKGKQWVGYHGPDNLRNIMRVVKRKANVGCFALWEVGYDDFNGFCGLSYPIARNCYRSLRSESEQRDSQWTDS